MKCPTRRPVRSDAPRITPPPRGWIGLSAVTALLAGCATYERTPLDPTEILTELRAVSIPVALAEAELEVAGEEVRSPTVEGDSNAAFDPTDGLSIDEAAAVAIRLNPDLAATRAGLGVAEAQLVQAGLLPDPTIGWDFNEDNVQFLLPLLRPDERGARRAVAEARIEEARWTLLRDEWRLARDVHLAILELLGARERVLLNEEQIQVVVRSHAFFARARSVGAVMALDEETAAIQAARVQVDAIRLAAEEERARQALNALLGLPPTTELPFESEVVLPGSGADEIEAAESLTSRAMRSRPDVMALMAVYERAEGNLRLAVARQWPQLAIGTSIQAMVGIFSDFNEPAIQVAVENRERIGRQVVATVHDVRAEVHDAVVALRQSRDELALLAREIAPRLEESLRLVELAVDAGQVTASEILLAQSQVLQARVQLLNTRITAAKRAATVAWVAAGGLEEDG